MTLNKSFWWLVGLPLWLFGGQGFAATLDDDLATLVGDWQGQGVDGTGINMSFARGQGNVLLTGSWKISGGGFARESGLSMVRSGGLCFLLPDASPFAPGAQPYSLMRLPGGGLRFTQLRHLDAENGSSVSVEEVRLSKQHEDGTRTLHLGTSEKLCADEAATVAKVCGEGTKQDYTLRKITH